MTGVNLRFRLATEEKEYKYQCHEENLGSGMSALKVKIFKKESLN